MKSPNCALTIAGTDPSGGAGIQADLKTFQELKTYGMSVITSVVAQNTTGVKSVHHLPLNMLSEQLEAVESDLPIHAFKTGMMADVEMMKVIKEWIQNVKAPFVMDPVMIATSGDPLINEDARIYLREELVPLTAIVTPNISEAEDLTGDKISTHEDMKEAAKKIVHTLGAGAALIKGGHMQGQAIDYLYDGKAMYSFATERIDTKNTHGTGCTYSAAITAYLSQGEELHKAVEKSKHFVTSAIRHSFELGKGNGPTNHWGIREEELTGEFRNYS
ncbi:bifunctional hydroxymethylpyrimidine kinase/phosphomethylpyrimidine kinase [Jeotgalibacillus proteolyticus]|uniref:Hydroxymethylpyrimidine/phosphomethylpyrimidine kinase n=1 Tax=Jeotgalibacillus proteolyticus TaxID=2082395 RepID=A0A2S5G8D0_9BACL|nr:bifunctional hydroxymethylpyrimidine kinase/phosphomethylpyrimidine kinase [Jeotgalibacillus proteolyticus]PPA69252.1 bifunctional hydroxymethylpyrimidine kinase/phosphomethylpyrimidine kinase [Jeotgalibacillus proteolyticus]